MATAFISPPALRLKRSSQSGSKAMTALMVVQYTESSPYAYIFAGAEIDLSPMLAGDTIIIRIRKQIVTGGGWVIHDQHTYIGAMPVTHPGVHINPLPDVLGVEIAMQQTLGVLRTIACEFFDAKRMGAD